MTVDKNQTRGALYKLVESYLNNASDLIGEIEARSDEEEDMLYAASEHIQDAIEMMRTLKQ